MLCEHHRPGRRCAGQRTQEDVGGTELDDWVKDRQADLQEADRSSSEIDIRVVGSGSSDDGNGRQDGPVIEGTSLESHFGRQSGYGLRGVRVGEASHPGPREARESTDDELPLVGDRNVIPRSAWARDVTGSVTATEADSEAAVTPSQVGEPTSVGIPMKFSPIGLRGWRVVEARPSNRRRTARPVEGRDVVQRTGPTQVDSDSDASPVDEALLDALEDDLRTPQRRTGRRVCSDSEGRHQSGGLASTLDGDARCSSADATTEAASSNAVRAAHVEFCQSVHRICTDTESSIEEIRMPTRVRVDSF